MHSIIFHAHQKIDRLARRNLASLEPLVYFPSIKQILKFEAGRGPDGAKLKRHKHSRQPWHFVNPDDQLESEIHSEISFHYHGLVEALKQKDQTRAGFEAAWLAHALVDGLTPAHHYPYEEELEDLRGTHRDTRKGLAGRLYVKGGSVTKTVKKSAKLIGPKGLLTSHAMFEAGAFTIIAPLRLAKSLPDAKDIAEYTHANLVTYFNKMVGEVDALNIYERFCKVGWTQSVARDVKKELAPRMVKIVTLAWYSAVQEAKA